MSFPLEIWGSVCTYLRPGDLYSMSMVARMHLTVSEDELYRAIDLRYDSYDILSPVNAQTVNTLFVRLASPLGDRLAGRIRYLDAVWNPEAGHLNVTQALCSALPHMKRLRFLRTDICARSNLLARLLKDHTWPELQEAYFDGAVVPRCFMLRHIGLRTLRSCLGFESDGEPIGVVLPNLINGCATCPEDATYLLSEQQPRLERIDIVTKASMMDIIVKAILHAPRLRELNIAWTNTFCAKTLLSETTQSTREQIESLGIWLFPTSRIGNLAGAPSNLQGALWLVSELAATFPSVKRLSFRYICIIQDRVKDQRAISVKLADSFENAVRANAPALPALREVYFGLAHWLVWSETQDCFLRCYTDDFITEGPIDDGW